MTEMAFDYYWDAARVVTAEGTLLVHLAGAILACVRVCKLACACACV